MLYAIAAALALIADQLLKYWTTLNLALGEESPLIDGIIHLTNVHNTGSAFSFLGGWAGARWLFLVLTVAFLVIVVMGFTKNIIRHPLGKITAALVTAGAVGNAIDRALYGFVVDMFEVEFMNFAVFNVADIFITCCGILFCVHVLLCKDSLVFEGDQVDTSGMNFDDELAPRGEKQPKTRAVKTAEATPAPASRPKPAAKPIPVFDPANPFAEWENAPAGEPAEAEPAAEEIPAEPAVPEAESAAPEAVPAAAPEAEPVETPAEAPAAEPEFISIPVPVQEVPAEEPEAEEEKPEAAPVETFEIGDESFSLDDILAEFSDN